MEKFSDGKEIPLTNVTKKVMTLAAQKQMPYRVYGNRRGWLQYHSIDLTRKSLY